MNNELGIRTTPLRDELTSLFLNHPGVAFSETEINDMVDGKFDRTSIYRSVKTLLEKVFIHKIICENGVLKYAHPQQHDVVIHHPHFQCTPGGKVSCLEEYPIAPVPLPTGYNAHTINLLVRGNCSHSHPENHSTNSIPFPKNEN